MARRVGRRALSRPAEQLAPWLLGKLLCRRSSGGIIRYRIMETECYCGEEDTVWHSRRTDKARWSGEEAQGASLSRVLHITFSSQ